MGRQQRYDRTETVEKAMNLFWRSGFSGTSMRDLEQGLDMRPGSIYANFGNKENLYMESMELYADKSFSAFRSHVDDANSFMEGLGLFIKQLIFSYESPCSCMLAKTLADINPDNTALREKAGSMIVDFENTISVELEKAKEAGEISKNCDVRSLARFIQVQIIGLRSYAEMQKSVITITELLDAALMAIKEKAGCKN